ncbi:hypothetical protein [Hyphomonas sp.]|uniref:hypothetical protein n=1 Tax=Hyphomonas sp. TaxID=87 RepID=UPI003D27985E
MKYLACLSLAFMVGATGSADQLPSKVRSGAYIEMIAQRGVECGHLSQWESLSLRAMALQDREGWSQAHVESLKTETAKRVAETECDAEMLTLWIEGARKGFDIEMLPPYLVAYKTLSRMKDPPHAFSAVALRLDKEPVISVIDAKLAELAATGRPAEGGKTWPDYIEYTGEAILKLTQQLEGEGGDQAAAWIAQSARIVETWYEEEIR